MHTYISQRIFGTLPGQNQTLLKFGETVIACCSKHESLS